MRNTLNLLQKSVWIQLDLNQHQWETAQENKCTVMETKSKKRYCKVIFLRFHEISRSNFFQTKHFILWFIAVFIGLCHQSIRNVWEPCRMPWHVSTFVSVISTLKYRLGMVCFQAALRFSSVTVDRSVCCARYMSCRTWYFAITCDVWIPKQGSN